MTYKTYFPAAIIALQEEILHHPQLLILLANHPAAEFEQRFAEIAAYCKVVMDDYYSQDDFVRIAELLIRILQSKRLSIILPVN